MSPQQRFAHYTKRLSREHCWIWTGPVNRYGYGRLGIGFSGSRELAHRFSWKIHRGSIPFGMCVLHKCDVPGCVNPAHLFLGTRTDNHNDKVAKGRLSYGETISKKLTEKDVLAIRKKYASGISQAYLGDKYGVDPSNISYIVRRKTWGWL